MVPFNKAYREEEDRELILRAFEGSSEALNGLVERHQRFIYNVALKLVRDRDDAADLTQEVLIKMLTKLKQYQSKSSFRTWLYRMVMNHFLSSKRGKAEVEVHSFDEYGETIDRLHNAEDMSIEEQEQHSAAIIAVRNKCMAGTLLCLDREQRMVLILGSIFNLRSNLAAEILDISPENFRKQLSRAKADLFRFMDNKCGLVNPANPCRCFKKTKGFIKEGLVSAQTGRFHTEVMESIASVVDGKNEDLDYLIEQRYLSFFTGREYEEPVVHGLLEDSLVKEVFGLS